MNKAAPLLILVVMLLMLLISWDNVLSYNDDQVREFNQHIKSAEEYAEKEIYIDAVKEYEAALLLKPDKYDVSIKIIDLYEKLDDTKSYVAACQKAIEIDKTQAEPYIMLAEHFIEVGNYPKAYKFLKQAEDNIEGNDKIHDLMKTVRSKYNLMSLEYDTFSGWVYENNGKTGYARISLEGKYGLLNSGKKVEVKCEYDDIGLLMNDVIPVKRDNEYFYVTKEGYRKLITDQPAEYLGSFTSKYAPAKIKGKYGYIDKKVKEYNFEYDYAGCFMNGIAAVQKNNKWAVINENFEEVTGFDFDEILMDEYGICSAYGVFWAKKGDKYYLYNTLGECVSDGYEDVKLFASDEAAAFKSKGKWGFIEKTGEILIEPKFDDADSFCIGYAPIKKNGKWGCIDAYENQLIEPTFDSMKAFSKNGYALVEADGMQRFAVVKLYE